MTCQIPERIKYKGQTLPCYSEPLKSRLPPPPVGMNVDDPDSAYPFEVSCSALWRGYVGHWEVAHNRLLLVALNGNSADGHPASLATTFPGSRGPIFADWFTGELKCPRGNLIGRVEDIYLNVYEEDVVLHVVAGIVVSTEIHKNRMHGNTYNP
jgi:hypothetical protein